MDEYDAGAGEARGAHGPFDDPDDDPRAGPPPPPAATAATANTNKREREPTMHWADTGFAGYMRAKVRKLEEQHRSNQALHPRLSRVFEGVAVHVNGLTTPSHSVSRVGRWVSLFAVGIGRGGGAQTVSGAGGCGCSNDKT